MKEKLSVRYLSCVAMFTALSYVAVLLARAIPNVQGFLSYEPKDAVIVIAGFIFGPLTCVVISVLCSLLEMLTISSTGIYGFVMNVVATCAFAVPAAWLYHRRRTQKHAMLGLLCGVLSMAACMIAWNYVITPFYMSKTPEAVPETRKMVAGMLATVFLPFNLVKSGVNAGLTLLLYKPIMQALRAAKLLPQREGGAHKYSAWPVILALVVLGVFIPLLLHLAGIF